MRAGDTVYLSGQVPLDPATMQLVSGDIEAQIRRVFDNLKAVAEAAGGSLAEAVKVTIFLTDLAHFAKVNEIMASYFTKPYPARSTVGVAQLPRGAQVEIECVLHRGRECRRARRARRAARAMSAPRPVTALRGVGAALAARLERLGVATHRRTCCSCCRCATRTART